jgi:hypothetical protein
VYGKLMGLVVDSDNSFFVNSAIYSTFFNMDVQRFDDFCTLCVSMALDISYLSLDPTHGGAWERYTLTYGYFPEASDYLVHLDDDNSDYRNELEYSTLRWTKCSPGSGMIKQVNSSVQYLFT